MMLRILNSFRHKQSGNAEKSFGGRRKSLNLGCIYPNIRMGCWLNENPYFTF